MKRASPLVAGAIAVLLGLLQAAFVFLFLPSSNWTFLYGFLLACIPTLVTFGAYRLRTHKERGGHQLIVILISGAVVLFLMARLALQFVVRH